MPDTKPLIHPNSPIHSRLGKRAPRRDKRTLQFSKYVDRTKLPLPPKEAGYSLKVQDWPMMLNDQLGDCVIAAAGHMVEQWTQYASGTPAIISDSDILKAYEDVGGYIPGQPWTDQGCDMLSALNYWRKTGIGGHKIAAYAALDLNQMLDVSLAVSLFGNVYLGVALPLYVQGSDVWEVPSHGPYGDGSPGSWGGHAIPIVGYSYLPPSNINPNHEPGLQVVSWGQIYPMTWNFIVAYADEAYAVISQDWINKNGMSPSGFNMKALLADLAEITK